METRSRVTADSTAGCEGCQYDGFHEMRDCFEWWKKKNTGQFPSSFTGHGGLDEVGTTRLAC